LIREGGKRQAKRWMGGRQEAGKRVDGRGRPKEKDEGGRNRGHRGRHTGPLGPWVVPL